MPTRLVIKEASLSEATKVHLKIPEFRGSGSLKAYEQRLKEIKGKKIVVFVAYYNEKPAGYVIGYDRDKDGSFYCWMAGVVPFWRRKGVLNSLMKRLAKWAVDNKYKKMKIRTRNERREMLSFLVKNGFYFTSVDATKKLEDYRLNLEKRLVK